MSSEEPPVIKFRNYKAQDTKLPVQVVDVLSEGLPSEQTKSEQTAELQALVENQEDESTVKIDASKENWDLERDISDSLEILEENTNRAIRTLLKKKLTESNAAGNIVPNQEESGLDVRYKGSVNVSAVASRMERMNDEAMFDET